MLIRKGNVGLVELIKYFPQNSIMIELGSYRGESTEIFLNSGKVKTIFCVDPWENGYDTNDICSYVEDMNVIIKDFNERTKKFNNCKKLIMYSDEAVTLFPNQTLDVVYIDANHTYEFCKRDILNYLPKLKKTGIISGHDYSKEFRGVTNAVNEIFQKPDFVFEDTSWMVRVDKKINQQITFTASDYFNFYSKIVISNFGIEPFV